jgi:hypothetical protein
MRLKLTLVLFLANVAVFFALWRLDREAEVVVAPSGPLTADMADLDRVAITGRLLPEAPQSRVLVRQKDGNWRIISQLWNWPANNFAVQNLVNQLQFLEQETSFPANQLGSSGQTLADYGLADPGLVLTLGAGTHTETLLVGSPTKLGGRLYVMNPADQLIRVVSQELLQNLTMPMDDPTHSGLRNPRIFSLPYFEVNELSVRGAPPSSPGPGSVAPPAGTQGLGTPRVTLNKKGDQWSLDTPVQCPADTELVNGVVAQLDALTVSQFLAPADQDPARQGLANPSMRVTLTGSTSQTLLLGSRVPPTAGGAAPNAPAEYYAQLEDPAAAPVPLTDDKGNPALGPDGKPAMAPPPVFTVAAGPFEILQNAQESLRERKFLAFNPAAITTLSIQQGNNSVRIQKLESGASWQVLARDSAGAPTPVPADTALVVGLLDNLQKLEAVSFASDAPSPDDLHTFGLDDPQRVVTLQGDKPLTFSLGVNTQVTPVRYYAQVEDAPFVYEIGPAILNWLQLNPLHYRDRVLEVLPAAAQVQSLRLTDLVSNQTVVNYTLDAQNTTWAAVLAKEPEPVRAAVLTLESTVRSFEVASYLQGNFTNNYSLDARTPTPWRYRLDAGIRLPGADQTQAQTAPWVCYFTDRLGGSTQIGGSPQPPMIFTLPQPLIDALYALTLARTPPPVVQKGLDEMNQPIETRSVVAPAPAIAPASATPAAAPPPATP